MLSELRGNRLVGKVQQVAKGCDDEIRVQLAGGRDVAALLAVEVLDADFRRHFGGQDLDVVLEKGKHLFDHQDPVASREVLLHEFRRKGPGRSHLQQPDTILHTEHR